MFKVVRVYLYKGNTVVLNKKDIKNAKDEDYQEVSLYLSDNFIKESYEELMLMQDDKDCYEWEEC